MYIFANATINSIKILSSNFVSRTYFLASIKVALLSTLRSIEFSNVAILINDLTKFIDNIMPGLYNLKKTYPTEVELVAKIDSIIVTLIDFKDKTRARPINIFRHRALSE